MGRLWLLSLDTERLRPRLTGAAAQAALAALAAAARATRVDVVDACALPSGIRAIIRADARASLRRFARRYGVYSGPALLRASCRWRAGALCVAIPNEALPSWRRFLQRCRSAFGKETSVITQSRAIERARNEARKTAPVKAQRFGARAARAGAALVRLIDKEIDARLGADDCSARLRRYVAEHDAPADESIAFGRLCEVIFAQGIGFPVVLRKRDALVAALEGFDPRRVAAFGDDAVKHLLNQPIIRNEAKIRACIDNARRWCRTGTDNGYLAALAASAALDDAAGGWPRLVAQLSADFVRINEVAARQTLKRWGFFTAFGHPGASRLAGRLGWADPDAPPQHTQLAIGAVATLLGRDPYEVEGVLAFFAAFGPCRPQPECAQCPLADRCPTGRHAGQAEAGAADRINAIDGRPRVTAT